MLSAIVDGRAGAAEMAGVRPHLRHCTACRATLRALYETEPALGALVPAGALVRRPGRSRSAVVARAYEALATGLGERLARLHAAVELVTSSKAAAVVASTAAVAAGGATVAEHAVPPVPAPAAASRRRRSAAAGARAARTRSRAGVTSRGRPARAGERRAPARRLATPASLAPRRGRRRATTGRRWPARRRRRASPAVR